MEDEDHPSVKVKQWLQKSNGYVPPTIFDYYPDCGFNATQAGANMETRIVVLSPRDTSSAFVPATPRAAPCPLQRSKNSMEGTRTASYTRKLGADVGTPRTSRTRDLARKQDKRRCGTMAAECSAPAAESTGLDAGRPLNPPTPAAKDLVSTISKSLNDVVNLTDAVKLWILPLSV